MLVVATLLNVLTEEQAGEWCIRAGLILDELSLDFPGEKHEFFIRAPEEFRRIVALTGYLWTFRAGTVFSGGLLWLRRFDIGGAPDVGEQLLEGHRRGLGDNRSLELTPAQLFREDEFLDLRAYLVQVIGFGWVADLVSPTGAFVLRFKDNRRIRVAAQTEADLKELRNHLADWNPTDEDPMTEEIRRREAERR